MKNWIVYMIYKPVVVASLIFSIGMIVTAATVGMFVRYENATVGDSDGIYLVSCDRLTGSIMYSGRPASTSYAILSPKSGKKKIGSFVK